MSVIMTVLQTVSFCPHLKTPASPNSLLLCQSETGSDRMICGELLEDPGGLDFDQDDTAILVPNDKVRQDPVPLDSQRLFVVVVLHLGILI